MAIKKLKIEQYVPAVKLNQGIYTAYDIQTTGSFIGGGSFAGGTTTITSTSANALAVGRQGATNPVLNIDASTASVATGIQVKGAAAAAGVAVSAISSGSNENLTVDALGTGTLSLQTVATGRVLLGQAATITTSSAAGFAVGRAGTTNSQFNVNAATSSAVTGINITGAASGAGAAISATSSATSENLTVSAKGVTGTITFNPAIVASAGGSAADGVMFGSLGVGVFTGTGTPTFSAMNGSIYVDSNATTTTTRMYVNKSGAGTAGTTWTNLTTAA